MNNPATIEEIDAAHERAAFMLRVEAATPSILVICDLCEAREFANPKTLRLGGWIHNHRETFCPKHAVQE